MVDYSTLSDDQLRDLYENRPTSTEPAPTTRIYVSPYKGQTAVSTEEQGKPQMGSGEALGRGAAQGLTFGFGDELQGILAAGGKQPDQPASLSNLASGLYKYWTGDPDAEKAYMLESARQRQLMKQAEEQHPVLYNVGQIGAG